MPKGQKHDEQDKKDAVARFKALGGDAKALKETAAELGVMPKTVQKWARSLNSKKAAKAPKRKTAKKVDPVSRGYDKLFIQYIEARDAAVEAFKKAEAAKKKLEAFVKGLK